MKQKDKKSGQPLTKEQQLLVVKNMPLAENLAKRYAGLGRYKGIAMEDLQQEAFVGLCEAAARYDASRGADFKTYAYPWCRKYILMAIKGVPETADDDVEKLGILDADDPLTGSGQVNDAEECAIRVEALLAVLDKKEQQVICLAYGIEQKVGKGCGEPLGFKEIARKMQLHAGRVHQIYEQAMAKMEQSAD